MMQLALDFKHAFKHSILPILVAAFCACASPEPSSDVIGLTSAIHGGALSREFAATGALVVAETGGLHCTATLVAPDLVLTAAHCMYPVLFNQAQLEFMIGAASAHRARSVPVMEIFVHYQYDDDKLIENGHDLAVVRLAEPITEVAPAVLYFGDATALIGKSARLVGYGAEGVDSVTKKPFGEGVRRATSVTLSELFSEVLHYDAQGSASCVGDSGGPAFVELGDAYALVGTNSYGDEDCLKFGRYQRVDIHRDWLASVGVPTQAPALSCVEDQICNGQCDADPDCVNLVCPLDPDDDDCEPVVTPPAACATFHAEPGMDGVCYYVADDNTICDQVPLQRRDYEADTNRCLYFDADGQACGAVEAAVSIEQTECVYVDPAGQECGRRPAACTTEGCSCSASDR